MAYKHPAMACDGCAFGVEETSSAADVHLVSKQKRKRPAGTLAAPAEQHERNSSEEAAEVINDDDEFKECAAREKRLETDIAHLLSRKSCGTPNWKQYGLLHVHMQALVDSLPEFCVHRCAEYMAKDSSTLYNAWEPLVSAPRLSSLAYHIRHEAYRIAQRRKKAHDDGTAVGQWVERPLLALTRADLEAHVIELVFNHLDEGAFQDRLDTLHQVYSDDDDQEFKEVRYG